MKDTCTAEVSSSSPLASRSTAPLLLLLWPWPWPFVAVELKPRAPAGGAALWPLGPGPAVVSGAAACAGDGCALARGAVVAEPCPLFRYEAQLILQQMKRVRRDAAAETTRSGAYLIGRPHSSWPFRRLSASKAASIVEKVMNP